MALCPRATNSRFTKGTVYQYGAFLFVLTRTIFRLSASPFPLYNEASRNLNPSRIVLLYIKDMAPLSAPDPTLLEQMRRGNRAALATVYDTYSPAIYRYLYRRTNNQRLAEDLTGVVFLKVLEAIRKQQAWTDTFVGWLYRIAHNAVVDHYRSAGRRQEEELAESLESQGIAPDGAAERAVRALQIQNALNTLTDDQAQVIVLRFGEGLSHQEVAVILNKSEGAVKLLQHRAVHALRRLLVAEEL